MKSIINTNNLPRIELPQHNRAEEYLNLPKLGKDDTFAFGCYQ